MIRHIRHKLLLFTVIDYKPEISKYGLNTWNQCTKQNVQLQKQVGVYRYSPIPTQQDSSFVTLIIIPH